MNIPKYEELRKNIKIDLEKSLSKSRFEHSIGVEYTAANLAMKYCVDKMEVCMLSGLLHDYTKNLSDEDQLKLAKSLNLYINPYEEKLPFLLHGKTAAEIVKNKYNICDEEILVLQKKLDCLKQEKKALMQQLLTGKKRVKVAA